MQLHTYPKGKKIWNYYGKSSVKNCICYGHQLYKPQGSYLFFFLQARAHIYIDCCVRDRTNAANEYFYNTDKLADWKAQLLASLFSAEARLSEYSQIYFK